MPETYTDAYCHIGLPRFGTAEDALAVADLWQITRSVLVLGPQVPDYATLFTALRTHGDRVRGIGIPFGETPGQVCEVAELQMRAGVLGLRMEPREVLSYPRVLERLGERGRWLYAIGALSSPELVQTLLAWLENYPETHIAAPHFLRPGLLVAGGDDAAVRALVSHPRFYPIFSRHGGMGSQQPYPHRDLAPWVRQVIALAGWDHVMWGSEYPVYYWRDETMPGCLGWLAALLDDATPEQLQAFLDGNARRAIFEVAPPPIDPNVTIPAWVEAQFNHARTVPLFSYGAELPLPMELYASLHHDYVAALRRQPTLTFADYIIGKLEDLYA